MSGRSAIVAGIVLPPLLFFGWMLTSTQTIGNDYPRIQVASALSVRFYASHAIEPMWYPHLAGGIPVGGLILAQYFHLPAWLLSHLPGYWSGHALDWMTVKHLVLWMLLHAAFYRAFGIIGLGRLESYLLSFSSVYNARHLDCFRYGTGLDVTVYGEAAVLLALGHVLRPSPIRLALLAALTQLMLTGGYPVLVPFLLLAALIAAAILAHAQLLPPRDLARRAGQAAAAALVGALLAAPNLAALADFLEVNHVRAAEPTLEWAGAWAMTPANPLRSAVFPWAAEVHSSIGGSTLIFLVLFTLLAWAAAGLRRRFVVFLVLAFPFSYALGSASPVFRLLRHLPGFASLRVPGRILTILPLLVLALIAWVLARTPADGKRPVLERPGLRRAARVSAALNAGLCLAALAVVTVGGAGRATAAEFSPLNLTKFWSPEWQALWLLLGIAASVAFAASPRRWAAAVLVAATLAQSSLLMARGTWIRPRRPTAPWSVFDSLDQLPFHAERPLRANFALNEQWDASATTAYTRFMKAAESGANCYVPIEPRSPGTGGVLLPFYLSDDIVCTGSREEALARLKPLGDCRSTGAVHTLVTAPDCRGFESSASPPGLGALNARNELLALTPNRARLAVDAPREAMLVTPFPDATRNWSGTVDGQPVPFVLVNGAFLGLRVPAGRHLVEVSYFSRRMAAGLLAFLLTAGVLLTAAAVVAARVVWPGRRGRAVAVGIAVAALAAVGAREVQNRFLERARADTLLHNSYRETLDRQLKRWNRLSHFEAGRDSS